MSASGHKRKISADMDALNAKIALGKHKPDVKHADHHADRLANVKKGDRSW